MSAIQNKDNIHPPPYMTPTLIIGYNTNIYVHVESAPSHNLGWYLHAQAYLQPKFLPSALHFPLLAAMKGVWEGGRRGRGGGREGIVDQTYFNRAKMDAQTLHTHLLCSLYIV